MNKTAQILIVDDDSYSRETLADLLTIEQYQIHQASSGMEALVLLKELAPDVILLDVMMPQLDGFATCRRIKEDPVWCHIPIILITALDDRDSIITGLDAGADEFLTKPMSGPVLRARVRSMLRIKQQYDDLQAAVDIREALSDIMIHDMRNPLAVAMLKCNVMLFREQLTQMDEAAVRMIHSQIRRLDAFIDDMLMTTRMENGIPRLNRENSNLKELLEQTIDDFLALAELTNIRFKINIPADLSMENIDAGLIARAIDNLLAQAFKHTPAGSTVQLCASFIEPRPGERKLHLCVTDEGPSLPVGIPQGQFNTAQIVALKQQGITQVSLGLAFCKQVVEAHGGQLIHQPNYPSGSVFTLEL